MQDDPRPKQEGRSGSDSADLARQFDQALNPGLPGSSSRSPESTQATPEDVLFGKIALELGFLQANELRACLKAQEDSRAQGQEVPLGTLLLARGLLKAEDLARIQVEQKRRSEGIPHLPRYEVRERAGEGATAVVYRAWDLELKRFVAIKVLREGAGLSDVARQRFRREAQATAGLVHPNVVLVHDAGEKDGRLYLVMELVDGRPLGEALKDGSKTEEQRLRLLEQAARGVGAAHAKGIVHRDLKPSNILVTAQGIPKVADFGLAHLVDSSTELTRTGSTLGTPLYMSPEQVEGKPHDITPRTDVYALGAILYEILTGRPPHRGETMMEIYGKIAREEPAAPRKLNPRVSLALETIALKAIEKTPGRRYPDADAFAEDLRRHLDGEAIAARPLPRMVRTARWASKYRAVLLPAAAVLLFGVAAVTWTTVRKSKQVKAELARAVLSEKEGRIEDAQLAYQAALALDSASPDAQAGLARTGTELRRREESQREADRLLETARHDLEAVYRYLYDPNAQYAELVRRVDAGQNLIDKAIALAPGKALGQYLLGRAWEIKGWEDRAEACYRKAIHLEPKLGPAHYQMGRLLLARASRTLVGTSSEEREARRKQAKPLIQEASRELDAAIKAGSGQEDDLGREIARLMLTYTSGSDQDVLRQAREALGRFSEKEGLEEVYWLIGLVSEGDAQVDAFNRALARRPKYPLVLVCRGAARLFSGDVQGAIADCDEALRVNPRLVEAHNNRGVGCSKIGDEVGALASFTRAVEIDPTYGPAYVNRAALRSERGDHEGALSDLARALELNPRSPLALLNRGIVRSRKGDQDGAIADFSEALALRPRYAEAYAHRGAALARKGDLAAAIRDLDESLHLDPGSAEALNNRGNTHLAQGDRSKAISDFSEAIRINSGFVEAYYNRGLARAAAEDFRGAHADLTRAIEIRPGWGAPYAIRAQVRKVNGDTPGALKDTRKALELGVDEAQRKAMVELQKRLEEEC